MVMAGAAPSDSLGLDLPPLPTDTYDFLTQNVALDSTAAQRVSERITASLPKAELKALRRVGNAELWRAFREGKRGAAEEEQGAKLLFYCGSRNAGQVLGPCLATGSEGFEEGAAFSERAELAGRPRNADGTFDLVLAEVVSQSVAYPHFLATLLPRPLASSLGLAPGAKVALYNPHFRWFVRMNDKAIVEAGGVGKVIGKPEAWLKNDWMDESMRWECFQVVDAGNGEIALHCRAQRRFLRLCEDCVDGKGGERDAADLPANWGAERFVAVDAGDGYVALHNRCANTFLRMEKKEKSAPVVNGNPCRKGVDELPTGWQWELFQVIPHNPWK